MAKLREFIEIDQDPTKKLHSLDDKEKVLTLNPPITLKEFAGSLLKRLEELEELEKSEESEKNSRIIATFQETLQKSASQVREHLSSKVYFNHFNPYRSPPPTQSQSSRLPKLQPWP